MAKIQTQKHPKKHETRDISEQWILKNSLFLLKRKKEKKMEEQDKEEGGKVAKKGPAPLRAPGQYNR